MILQYIMMSLMVSAAVFFLVKRYMPKPKRASSDGGACRSACGGCGTGCGKKK